MTARQVNQRSFYSFPVLLWEFFFVKTLVVVIFSFVYLDCDMCVQFLHQYSLFSLADSSEMRIQKHCHHENDK
jgi:hypothetical protein